MITLGHLTVQCKHYTNKYNLYVPDTVSYNTVAELNAFEY